MKLLAVISEYNPFTFGHEYHLKSAREKCNADYVINIISGQFLQRGEPAILDKYVRAHTALLGGSDAVIELPCIFAISNAEIFAVGAVKTAKALGADEICCGCEHTDIALLNIISEVCINEPQAVSLFIKAGLSAGISYPAVRAASIAEYLSADYDYDDVLGALVKPNSILALEYLKAIKKFAPEIKLSIIKRSGADYKDTASDSVYPSATAVRAAINSNENFKSLMPDYAYEDFKSSVKNGIAPVTLNNIEQAILYSVRSKSAEQLSRLYSCPVGMGNLIKSSALSSSSLKECLAKCANKSYSDARIRRLFLYSLLDYYEDTFNSCLNADMPLHVLGARNNGILSELSARSGNTLITRASQFPAGNPIFDFGIKASNIYSLALPNADRSGMKDYTHKLELI